MTTEKPGMSGQDTLERFVRALSRLVHEERRDALDHTVTVAELYQDIAPYRRMRELAGFEMHADYEHALIRFLAGVGGCARLDPESAADELAIEAESADPDLSIYRKFAACEVQLTLGAPRSRPSQPIELELAHAPMAAPAPAPVAAPAPAPVAAPAPAPIAAPAPAPMATPAPMPMADIAETMRALGGETADRVSPQCGSCGHSLPTDRDVRFCPFCGADQTIRTCAACGELLEDGWRFCVACGVATED